MAKTKEWLFNTSTGMPVRVTLVKNKLVSVNGSPETKVMAFKSPESNFAERVFNIPGKVQDLKTLLPELLVHGFQRFVMRRKTAARGGVDDQQHLAFVIAQADLVSFSVLDLEIVNAHCSFALSSSNYL